MKIPEQFKKDLANLIEFNNFEIYPDRGSWGINIKCHPRDYVKVVEGFKKIHAGRIHQIIKDNNLVEIWKDYRGDDYFGGEENEKRQPPYWHFHFWVNKFALINVDICSIDIRE